MCPGDDHIEFSEDDNTDDEFENLFKEPNVPLTNILTLITEHKHRKKSTLLRFIGGKNYVQNAL